jgi:hypothetical protein
MLLCERRQNNYCSLSNTTQTQTQQYKNGRGERIESSYVLLITIYINTRTIQKWKVIKIIFLEVYCKLKHDVKTLKTHMATTLICKNT